MVAKVPNSHTHHRENHSQRRDVRYHSRSWEQADCAALYLRGVRAVTLHQDAEAKPCINYPFQGATVQRSTRRVHTKLRRCRCGRPHLLHTPQTLAPCHRAPARGANLHRERHIPEATRDARARCDADRWVSSAGARRAAGHRQASIGRFEQHRLFNSNGRVLWRGWLRGGMED